MTLVKLLGLILFFVLPITAFSADEKDQDKVKVKDKNESYVLRPNDTISLSVYGEPDLSVSVRILKTGESSFPLLGAVKVTGMSVTAATAYLRDLYAKDYLVDPKLNLTVVDTATEFVAVFGAVRTPGQIPVPGSGHLDLITVMTAVGGLAENADDKGIQLIRATGSTTTFSMEAIQGSAGRTQLAGGDRIVVSQSAFVGKTVIVLGQVGKPGPIPYPLKGKLDLTNALALAGGSTPLANLKKVSINRKGTVTVVDYRENSQRGDHPFLLYPDDVVTVPERWL